MDQLTKTVQEEIARQYRSVRQFAFAVGIPLSTINSALHNGVGGSSHETVIKICSTLGIKGVAAENGCYLAEDAAALLEQYARLDGYGRRAVELVLQAELERCDAQPRSRSKRTAE